MTIRTFYEVTIAGVGRMTEGAFGTDGGMVAVGLGMVKLLTVGTLGDAVCRNVVFYFDSVKH